MLRSFIQAEFFQGCVLFANPMMHFAINPRKGVGVANCFDQYVIDLLRQIETEPSNYPSMR